MGMGRSKSGAYCWAPKTSRSPGLPLGRSRRMVNLMAGAGSYSTKAVMPLARDRVEADDHLGGEGTAPLHHLVRLAVREDDVERDLVHPGVLAPDGLGQLHQRLRRHPPTTSPTISSVTVRELERVGERQHVVHRPLVARLAAQDFVHHESRRPGGPPDLREPGVEEIARAQGADDLGILPARRDRFDHEAQLVGRGARGGAPTDP